MTQPVAQDMEESDQKSPLNKDQESLTSQRILIASLFLPFTVFEEPVSSSVLSTPTSTLAPPQHKHNTHTWPSDAPQTPPAYITWRRITRPSISPFLAPTQWQPNLTSSPGDHNQPPPVPPTTTFTLYPSSLGNIGLHNAVRSAVDQLGPVYWIGLPGVQTDGFNEAKRDIIRNKLGDYMCIPVFPTDDEAEGHYHRFCKQVCAHL